jgi:hypothetical protein
VASSVLSGVGHRDHTVASEAADGYYVDSLLRSDHLNANATDQDVRAETSRILASGIRHGDVPAAGKTYLLNS